MEDRTEAISSCFRFREWVDRNKGSINVLVLGVSFMLVFTAFQTGAMIQASVLESVRNETKNTSDEYTGDGYVSLAIIYLVFSVANWISAPVVAVVGPRLSMFLGALVYTGFVGSFILPKTWALYFMSTLLGIAAAVIWTAQGSYLTLNSTKETMARNSGLFWAIFQCSLLFGNLFVHFEFLGVTLISDNTRYTVYGTLTAVGVLGTLLMLMLGKPSSELQEKANSELGSPPKRPVTRMLEELATAFRLLRTKDMILMSAAFFYSGLELTYFSGVYGTSITHTSAFGTERESLIGISGMLIGAGEIIGGLTFGIFGKTTNKYGRDLIILLGYVIHMLSFFLIFLNLPDNSPIDQTADAAHIDSSKYLALACSFLLGFGDACYNTQLYSILGSMYPDESGPAFSLFKFVQSLSAAIAFFYSRYLRQQYQLLILVITGTLGSLTFFSVEWTQHHRSAYTSLNT